MFLKLWPLNNFVKWLTLKYYWYLILNVHLPLFWCLAILLSVEHLLCEVMICQLISLACVCEFPLIDLSVLNKYLFLSKFVYGNKKTGRIKFRISFRGKTVIFCKSVGFKKFVLVIKGREGQIRMQEKKNIENFYEDFKMIFFFLSSTLQFD